MLLLRVVVKMFLFLLWLLPQSGIAAILQTAPSSLTVAFPSSSPFGVHAPNPILASIPFTLFVTLPPLDCQTNRCEPWPSNVQFNLTTPTANFSGTFHNVSSLQGIGAGLSFLIKGVTTATYGANTLSLTLTNAANTPTPTITATTPIFTIVPLLSVFPPLITLVLAVMTKQVLPSLLAGVFSGALLTASYNPLTAFCTTFSTYFVGALTDNGHGPVILFALILGGVLELVDKSGGANGLADKARTLAYTRMRALLCAWALSVLVFFDDYSAILIVGSMLKDSLRKVRMSPAKLAFIIHMVGVNLPSIMPVSSWVGVELGYIADSYSALHLNHDHGAFSVFLRTLPYRFFPILAIIYPLLSIVLKRDFGALLKAEHDFLVEIGHDHPSPSRTQYPTTEEIEHGTINSSATAPLLKEPQQGELAGPGTVFGTDESTSANNTSATGWWPNAVVPFSVIVLVTFVGIFVSGAEKVTTAHPSLVDIVANADSVDALLWSAAAASAVAMLMYGTCQRIMTLEKLVAAWTTGFKEMMEPLLILLLAWALGAVVNELQTSVFLSSMLGGALSVKWLPVIATLMAGLVSFASGSAMGTMGILFPIILPLANTLSAGDEASVMQAAGAVFAGSTFGNTASPIADNTVLSSIATDCDLVVHAQTMLPASCLIFVVSILCGTVPVSLGWYSPLVALLVSVVVLALVLVGIGENVETKDRGCKGLVCCRCVYGEDEEQ